MKFFKIPKSTKISELPSNLYKFKCEYLLGKLISILLILSNFLIQHNDYVHYILLRRFIFALFILEPAAQTDSTCI